MSKEVEAKIIKKAGEHLPNGGYSQKELYLAFYMFYQGYIRAEKDLELTWEDLATIEKLGNDFIKLNKTPMSDEKFYKEVLKRFKERK